MASKYHNRKTEYGGVTWDSAGEAEYARHLDLLKADGQIADWRRGREWLLLEPPNKIALNPDFEVWAGPVTFSWSVVTKRKKVDGKRVNVEERIETPSRPPDRLIDFKGMVTPVFRIKAKLFKARYPGVPLMIVKADGVEVAA